MDSGEAADLAIFICCSTLLLLYSLVYFRVASFSLCGKRFMNLYALNKQTRKEWVVLLSQGGRPGLPGCHSSTCAAGASGRTVRRSSMPCSLVHSSLSC